MTFTIDLLPRSDTDARLTFVVDADDWLEALSIGLEEAGMDPSWTGRAQADVLPGGVMRVVDAGTGRVFDVRAEPAEALAVPEPLPLFAAAPEPQPGPAPAPALVPDLDESSLERYFDDAVSDDEVRAVIRGQVGEWDDAPAAAVHGSASASPPVQASDDLRARGLALALENLATYEEDTDALLDFFCFSLLGPLGADVACVLLLDKKGKNLVFAGVAGDAPAKLWRFRYPRGLGLPWLALERAAPLVVNGAERDPHFAREIVAKTGFRVSCTILSPVPTTGGSRGVVQVVRNGEAAPHFCDADAHLVESAARELGQQLDALDARA